MAKEKNLTAVTSVAAADFARVVTSAGASVKATFANVAKYIIETYNGSTVAGSAQSVKSALDSLNSKQAIIATAYNSRVTINSQACYRLGNLVNVSLDVTASQNLSSQTAVTGLPAPSVMQYLSVSKGDAYGEIRTREADGIILSGISNGDRIRISGSYIL